MAQRIQAGAQSGRLLALHVRARAEAQRVKLTVTHAMEREDSKFIKAVSDGWPRILSNLKSPLETGDVVLKA